MGGRCTRGEWTLIATSADARAKIQRNGTGNVYVAVTRGAHQTDSTHLTMDAALSYVEGVLRD